MKELGIAEGMSSYAKRHLFEGEFNEILEHLPCKVFSTDIKSKVDDYTLVKLESMDEPLHPIMLNISN